MLLNFGFFDSDSVLNCAKFKIYPDNHFDREKIKEQTDDGWYTSKSIKTRRFTAPYNYIIDGNFESIAHATYCVWCLSFLSGVRLGTIKNEFIDALCIEKNSLGFVVFPEELIKALNIVYLQFTNEQEKLYLDRVMSIVNLIFLSQNKYYERRESYMYLYMALDTCFAILRDHSYLDPYIGHLKRAAAIADLYTIKRPIELSNILKYRNDLFHEGLISGKPLGYEPVRQNLLFFRNFICKILFCIIGINCTEFIESVPCETLDLFPIVIK